MDHRQPRIDRSESRSPRAWKLLSALFMKQLILDQHGRLYEQTDRRADARLFSRGDLVRFPQREGAVAAGAVLRVDSIDSPSNHVGLRRRSGEVIPWSPTSSAQVFAESSSHVKVGMVFEWKGSQQELGAQSGDLGRVSDIHPNRGVTIQSRKLGETRFELEAGAWHYAVTRSGIVAHLREVGDLRLEAYRDVDPAPEAATHDRPFDELARPYSLVTHGSPPPIEVFERGDVVYFSASRALPENHVFMVREISNGALRLVDGRELSVDGAATKDVSWKPNQKDELRLYKPARAVAAQDLVLWKQDDPHLLVRRGTYAEVLEVRAHEVVVAGMTSTPEVLPFDRKRWSPRWHRENGTWHLERSEEAKSHEQPNGALAIAISTA